MPLTSLQNPLLQRVRRAVQTGRPLEDGSIVAEGPHLLQEALSGSWKVRHVLVSSRIAASQEALIQEALQKRTHSVEVTEVAERTFSSLADTEHTQGILFLVQPASYSWDDLARSNQPLVILDGIQDPGNAGTIVRSAEAFGSAGVVFTLGSVRFSNGKLLRASAGSSFRIPYLEGVSRAEVVAAVRSVKRPLYVLTANAERSITNAPFIQPFAIVVGNEGSGVSEEFQAAGQPLSIATQIVESLNAAVACSITLFEAARQRALNAEAP